MRVLFLGNSFTEVNNLPWLVHHLAESADVAQPFMPTTITVGGATLEDHWHNDHVRHTLQQHAWAYVVLQEQSTRPIDQPDIMCAYTERLHRLIMASGATTVLFLTWTRRDRPEMQPILNRTYQQCAQRLGAKVAPVGVAWHTVLGERADLVLHEFDGMHPAPLGSYLAAGVIYATLYGTSPVGLSRRIFSTQFQTPTEGTIIELASLSESDAHYLQEIAWQTAEQWT